MALWSTSWKGNHLTVCHPQTIISDNSAPFIGRVYSRWCQGQRIEKYYTPIYHQRANPVERRVQEFKKTLRILTLEKQDTTWDKYIAKALYVLRMRSNAATGMTPAKAVLGYELPKQGGMGDTAVSESARHAGSAT
ncbi:hypothetical protein NQ314_001663 [Rhamnusium bicolor]|uniref:Integrase catalytic domain-containing protein n=1 Tax=Rhamnusium bicolor TaxID=1586634 RepID=A0AAV8ZRR4_9CUCU|nr:hypothetical protein NQ314_001663 [Rhamnusium bicolor]